MKRYSIKCLPGNTEFIDILNEDDSDFHVRFTRDTNGSVKTTEETITRHLFNICVQTGYISPVAEYSVA
ncbi:MAG: hypothetical protein FWC97_08825 [Treponema sp.]|nr:hypothetical protein [Treponema sp.]